MKYTQLPIKCSATAILFLLWKLRPCRFKCLTRGVFPLPFCSFLILWKEFRGKRNDNRDRYGNMKRSAVQNYGSKEAKEEDFDFIKRIRFQVSHLKCFK